MKSINKFVLAALFPMTALTITSCEGGSARRILTYQEAKEFVAEHYDKHALDSALCSYTNNLNTMYVDIDLEYETPAGMDGMAFGFGGSNTHVTTHNKYAYVLSSAMLDKIENANSVASALSLEIIDVVPIALDYIEDNGKMTIELGIAPGQAVNFLVKLACLITGAMELGSTTFGYAVPKNGSSPLSLGIKSLFSSTSSRKKVCDIINYYSFTVNTSSTSKGDKFLIDVDTDKDGFFNHYTAITGGEFNLTGFFSQKYYASEEPNEGDQPIRTSDPFAYTLKGSIDFDLSADVTADNK